ADDIRDMDLLSTHYISGPIGVEGAKPGDCLVIEILDVNYFENMPWGYTGICDRKDGGLLGTEFNSKAAKVIWDLEGIYASSRHIHGVRFAGIPHPGIIGTAPSAELLDKWNKREEKLIADHPNAIPPLGNVPNPKGVYIGQDIPEDQETKIALQGARTFPGRENGGNCDIKDLSKYPMLPAFEIILLMGCSGVRESIYQVMYGRNDDPSPIAPQYNQQVVFEGISADVHGDGKQYNLDATVAYKQAALNAITYLGKVSRISAISGW
ncbi:hypothetical protein C0989_001680, partial [Termitomyces sp. Mn162]